MKSQTSCQLNRRCRTCFGFYLMKILVEEPTIVSVANVSCFSMCNLRKTLSRDQFNGSGTILKMLHVTKVVLMWGSVTQHCWSNVFTVSWLSVHCSYYRSSTIPSSEINWKLAIFVGIVYDLPSILIVSRKAIPFRMNWDSMLCLNSHRVFNPQLLRVSIS